MRCEQVVDELSTLADGSATLAPEARRHVERCLRCQAEVVQYRRLLRALRSLRTEVIEPSPGVLVDLLAAIESDGDRTSVRAIVNNRRLAYLGGLAAATAAGAAGIVLASRGRRTLAG